VEQKVEDRRLVVAEYLLTAVAGWVDAQGFLALQGLYVSFMSGNTTRFGLNLGLGRWSDAQPLGMLIGLFLTGGFLGAILSGLSGRRSIPLILSVEGTVLLVALVLAETPGMATTSPDLLALAMGVQNAAVVAVGPARVGLTYVTGTLFQAGQELGKVLLGTGSIGVFMSNILSWIVLFLGVVAGTVAHTRFGLTALSVPSLLVFGLAASFGILTAWNGAPRENNGS
jgi:uncharacterized membrane protein YoaK (UPF0700 family)